MTLERFCMLASGKRCAVIFAALRCFAPPHANTLSPVAEVNNHLVLVLERHHEGISAFHACVVLVRGHLEEGTRINVLLLEARGHLVDNFLCLVGGVQLVELGLKVVDCA